MRESSAWKTPGEVTVHDIGPTSPDGQAPVVRLVNLMLAECITSSATSLKLDTAGDVTFEITGEWKPVMKLPPGAQATAVNRLKIMAQLDISRRPSQQGSMMLKLGERSFLARIGITNTPEGEEAVVSPRAIS